MDGNSSRLNPVARKSLEWPLLANPNPLPPLLHNEIHLWAMDLGRVSETLLGEWIQPAEFARAERIVDAHKRQLYLGGRIGLRYLLSGYTGIPNVDLRFGYGSRGKPTLINQNGSAVPKFNYTLSRDRVLYAISNSHQLGVDLEVLPRIVAAERMAQRLLTKIEQDAWLAIATEYRNEGMLSCWTRKEAYGKTLGVGIRYRLGAVSLFKDLASSFWKVKRAGLFTQSGVTDMPEILGGVQIKLPFQGVASLMYGLDNVEVEHPVLRAGQFLI